MIITFKYRHLGKLTSQLLKEMVRPMVRLRKLKLTNAYRLLANRKCLGLLTYRHTNTKRIDFMYMKKYIHINFYIYIAEFSKKNLKPNLGQQTVNRC